MALYNWTNGELVTAEKLNAYGEGMEQLKADAASANASAQEAKEDAETAKTAAETANASAQAAKIAAETAKEDAEASKTAAADSASAAAFAKNAAESANTSAQAAKTAAETAKGKAEAANTSAQEAKNDAQTAAQGAGAAKENAQASAASAAADARRAEDAVAHNPTIQNGIWYVWNPDTGSYASTDVPATGQMTVEVTYQQGDSATTPPTGTWLASPPEVSQGKYLWTKEFFSDGTIGYSVARQGVDGTGAVVSGNGKSGEVTLTTDDISEGTKKYVTAAEKNKLENAPDDTNAALVNKVDKVSGKGLSTEDYATADKNKVTNLPANTSEELAKKAVTLNMTVSLGTAWTAKTGYVQQTVTVEGILATDTPILDLITTTAGFESQQEAWGKVFKAQAGANQIIFYASEATETSININIKVVR